MEKYKRQKCNISSCIDKSYFKCLRYVRIVYDNFFFGHCKTPYFLIHFKYHLIFNKKGRISDLFYFTFKLYFWLTFCLILLSVFLLVILIVVSFLSKDDFFFVIKLQTFITKYITYFSKTFFCSL